MIYNISVISNNGKSSEVSRKQYNKTKKSILFVRNMSSLELKYNAILQNMFDYEKNLINFILRNKYFSESSYKEMNLLHNNTNRIILNILNSIYMYREHLRGDFIDDIFTSKKDRQDIEQIMNRAHKSDSLILLTELRNFLQHRNSMNLNISMNDEALEENSIVYIKKSLWIGLDISNLMKDERIKKSLNQIKYEEREIDLTREITSYVDIIGSVHQQIIRSLSTRLSLEYSNIREIVGEDLEFHVLQLLKHDNVKKKISEVIILSRDNLYSLGEMTSYNKRCVASSYFISTKVEKNR